MPRASNSYQRLAVLTAISAPKHALKRENKEQNKGRWLDPGARAQRRTRSPRPAWGKRRDGGIAPGWGGRRHGALLGHLAPVPCCMAFPMPEPQLLQPSPFPHHPLFLPYAPSLIPLLGQLLSSPGTRRGPVSRVASLGNLLAAFATCKQRCWWGEQVTWRPFYKVRGIILALNQCR